MHTAEPPLALYVEDHPTNVLLMQALFARTPQWRLAIAVDGREAVELLQLVTPSLLLLDLNLPDCHGSLLLRNLRAVPHLRDVPAIAVTADHSFEIEGTSFLELWPKPLNLRRVQERLEQLLPTSGSPPQLLHRAPIGAISPIAPLIPSWAMNHRA